MYKVTLWHVGVTNFVIEMQQFTLCIVELHVKSTVFVENIYCCTIMLLWHIYFASNNKMQFSLCVRCPKYLSDFNQILVFLTDFHKGPQCQILKEIRPVEAAVL